jgi:hypothetical protein
MWLLTIPVIIFQVAIFSTITGAAATSGRSGLTLTTVGWVAFTLFGSIFTAGLLLLQLITIFVAYGIGSESISEADSSDYSRSETRAASESRESAGNSSWMGTIVGIVAIGAFVFNLTTNRSSPSATVQPPQQARVAPTEPQRKSQLQGKKVEAKVIPPKKSADVDMRYCLKLKTDAEIMRCANQSR